MINPTKNPHLIRMAQSLMGKTAIPLGLVAPGGVFIVKSGYESGIRFDSKALIKSAWEARGYFYRVDSYNGVGTWFRAVRCKGKEWEFVHANDQEMPFCCSADMLVYLIEGNQQPRPEMRLLPPHPQLKLPLPP